MTTRRIGLGVALALALVCGVTAGCEERCEGPGRCQSSGKLPLAKLSDYDFWSGPMVEQVPKEGVVPYTVAAPLWSDQAGKGRFIFVDETGMGDYHLLVPVWDDRTRM